MSTLSFFSPVSSVLNAGGARPTDWDSEPTMSESSASPDGSNVEGLVAAVSGVMTDLLAVVQSLEQDMPPVSESVSPEMSVVTDSVDVSKCATPATVDEHCTPRPRRAYVTKRNKACIMPTKSSHVKQKRCGWNCKRPTFVTCMYCSFTLSVMDNVQAHKVEEHQLFVCRFGSCLSDWTVKTACNIHEQVHQTCKFVCDTCEAQFDCYSVYKRHLVKHAEMQQFICSVQSCQ